MNPLNIIRGWDGKLSSGKIIKIAGFIIAAILALNYKDTAILSITAFLGLSLGSEITQKATAPKITQTIDVSSVNKIPPARG